MIHVAATIRVHPEKQDEALVAARRMQEATREESGCVQYRFWRDLDASGTLFVYERWADAAALQAHFRTPHMAAFQAALEDLLSEPIQLETFELGPVEVTL